jgi:hypothetical protein
MRWLRVGAASSIEPTFTGACTRSLLLISSRSDLPGISDTSMPASCRRCDRGGELLPSGVAVASHLAMPGSRLSIVGCACRYHMPK